MIEETKRKIWFCYEPNFAKEWQPKLYYDHLPKRPGEGGADYIRTGLVKLTPGEIEEFYKQGFGFIINKYPPPERRKPKHVIKL